MSTLAAVRIVFVVEVDLMDPGVDKHSYPPLVIVLTFLLTAHELGHAFGLGHDNRGKGGKWISTSGVSDPMVTSFCAAEWVDVHRAFNPRDSAVGQNEPPQVKMLAPSLAFPPNGIRLRFKITSQNELHQAQLHTPELEPYLVGGFIGCKALNGSTNATVEFVTTELRLKSKEVSLNIIDVDGDFSYSEPFPIDVPTLLPPPKVVSIPDANLAAAVRTALDLAPRDTLTTRTMSNLTHLEVPNSGITDLTGIEHAHHLVTLNLQNDPIVYGTENVKSNAISDISPLKGLTQLKYLNLSYNSVSDVSALEGWTQLKGELHLSGNRISDVSPLTTLTQLDELYIENNRISDVSPLATLTQLRGLYLDGNRISDVSPLVTLISLKELWLEYNRISDVSPLATLTRLPRLWLSGNNITDVSALAELTQLTGLGLRNNNISDVSALVTLPQMEFLRLSGNPLSFDAINTHIPAMKVKGVEVHFEDIEGEFDTYGEISKITGPWLWMIAPTQTWQGGATSTDIDSLAIASSDAITESDVATYGAKAGDTIGEYTWTLGTISATGPNNINELINHIGLSTNRYIDDHSSYALITLESATVQSGVTMKAGSDDSIKIWLNGEVVHKKPVNRGAYDFLDSFKVDLKTGDNLLLVKVSERGGDWSMFVGVDADVNAIYKPPQGIGPRVDVNGDGVVNIQDLVLVSSRFGQTGENSADVNGDGVINIADLVLVAGAFGGKAGAAPLPQPSALEGLTASAVQHYLIQAHRMAFTDPDALRGIAVLEQLLALLAPKETALLPNYPNPFNPETWIPYQLAKPAEVTLYIYGVKGELVRTLALGHQPAGMYHSKNRAAYWDGRNAQGEKVASGVYFYTV